MHSQLSLLIGEMRESCRIWEQPRRLLAADAWRTLDRVLRSNVTVHVTCRLVCVMLAAAVIKIARLM